MEFLKPRGTAIAHRRQRQIEDCLFENLLHRPYTSISVSDICRQVGISRKAYYNYYHDKEACFCTIISRKLQEGMLHVASSVPDDAPPLESCIVLLDYWKNQKPLLDILVRNNLLHYLMLQSIHYTLTEDRATLELLNTPDVKSDTDILSCYMSSHLTLVLQWYLRDFDTPTEVMAKKLMRILHLPLIALPKDSQC